MLIPQNIKFKKQQKGKNLKKISKVLSLSKISRFGSLRFYAVTAGKLNLKQVESFKFLINKKIKRFGKVCFYLSLDKPVTKKPVEVRMGKGKGNVDHWVCKIKKGFLILEIKTIFNSFCIQMLKPLLSRFPVKIKIKI